MISLDGNKEIPQENDEGFKFKIKNRAIRERGSRALLSFPGICKRADSVLKFREPNSTNLTRNGVHKLDLSSITLEEVVLFVNTYFFGQIGIKRVSSFFQACVGRCVSG